MAQKKNARQPRHDSRGSDHVEEVNEYALLREAITESENRLRVFRAQKAEAVRHYVGKNHGENGSEDRQPLNMVELAVNIYQQSIASGVPQVTVATPYPDLTASAADLELATNYVCEKMRLGDTLNEAATEALFAPFGIVKVGVSAEDAEPAQEGILADSGEIFASSILFEDFFFDMTTKRGATPAYMGHYYSVETEWVLSNPNFRENAKRQIQFGRTDEWDEASADSTRSEAISAGSSGFHQEFAKRTDLMEVWLPMQGKIVTLAANEAVTEPLEVKEWKGPRRGPYHLVIFNRIPGNLLGLPPASNWIDTNAAINRVFNKVIRQADRQKTVTGVTGSAKNDADRIVNCSDGDVVYLDDPRNIAELGTGGPNQASIGLAVWMRDIFSYLAGNLDALGGLSTQSDTVGQDKLINESASQRMKHMQRIMVQFTQDVVTDIAWHLWEDPLIDLPLTKRIPGTDYSIPIRFTPDRRMGEFFHYNFKVEPYSLQSRTPAERLQTIKQFVAEIVLPMLPMLQQTGKDFDFERFAKLFAKYSQTPEIADLIVYLAGEAYPRRESVKNPGMPPQTTRNYVRHNQPAGSRQGKDQALAAMLFGGAAQPAEAAATFRPG